MQNLSVIDVSVFIGYFVVLLFIGFWSGRKEKTDARDFFITANRLPWYVIGFSLIAAGISSEQFLGTVGFAYEHGLAVANWEWSNGPSLIILILIFVPFYLRKKIITMPQFLEKRFGGDVRTLFAVITLITYVFINLAGVIYSGGFALNKIFGINLYLAIWGMTIIAGTFAIYGGMASVAWTHMFQSILLLGSGLLVFVLGLIHIPGGFTAILGEGTRSHLILPPSDPHLPGTGMIVLAFSTNIWYYCTNQCINQTTLGAKNEWHAKIGIVFAGFLLILIAFADAFPGMIAFVMNPNLPPDSAYPYVVKQLIPMGLRGLVFAGLCGAIMSTIEAMLNAASTIFTFDIYQRFINKEASSDQMIKMGRICGSIVLVIAAIWAPVVMKFGHIFSYFQECWAFVAIPVAVIFVMGVLWKGVTNKAALWTLYLSFPMLVLPYLLRIFKVGMNVFNVAGFVLIFTILFIWIVSILTKDKEGESFKEFIWKPSMNKLPDEITKTGYPLYKRIGFWMIIMSLIYLILYIKFW